MFLFQQHSDYLSIKIGISGKSSSAKFGLAMRCFANLSDSVLESAKLSNADCHQANLSGANLRIADLRSASFISADLVAAALVNAIWIMPP